MLQAWIYAQSKIVDGVRIEGKRIAPALYYAGLIETTKVDDGGAVTPGLKK